MKHSIIGITVIAVSGFLSVAVASSWTGNVNLSLGMKFLDEDDWSPLEEQAEGGLSFDIGKTAWPVHILVESLYSKDDDVEIISGIDYEATTTELILGVKKIWMPSRSIRPFIGGGLCLASAEMEASQGYQKISDDDSGVGFSISGGVYWTLGQHFNLGVDLRYSSVDAEFFAELPLDDHDVAIGGIHSALMFGYHW